MKETSPPDLPPRPRSYPTIRSTMSDPAPCPGVLHEPSIQGCRRDGGAADRSKLRLGCVRLQPPRGASDRRATRTPTTLTSTPSSARTRRIPSRSSPAGSRSKSRPVVPNFYTFGDDVRYEIHVDNNGDGKGDINYDFRFQKHTEAKNAFGIPTYLYNDGPITSLDDPNWLVPQTYKVWKNGKRIGPHDLETPPATSARARRPTMKPIWARRPSTRWTTAPGSSPVSVTIPSSSIPVRSSTSAGCAPSTAHTCFPSTPRPVSTAWAASTSTASPSRCPSSS